MRRILALTVIAVALVACGASAASTQSGPMRIEFGIAGGNLVPFQVTIERTGHVHASGLVQPAHRRLSHAKVSSLSRTVRRDFAAGLKSRQCAGTNPDIGSTFVRAEGRTVRVHGSCEPRFHRLWNTLAKAVGIPAG
jgi:hypothetical protein